MQRTHRILDADSIRTLPQKVRRNGLQLDCAETLAITAGGLGQLVRWHLHLRTQGRRLVLVHVGEEMCEILEVTQLTLVLDVHPASPCRQDEVALLS
jgi:anti-anti-sigma regulatory factor